tara:strand:- start:170 stop:3637 length:3468 start_codon:yes stop_codon:yes gene_type:complete
MTGHFDQNLIRVKAFACRLRRHFVSVEIIAAALNAMSLLILLGSATIYVESFMFLSSNWRIGIELAAGLVAFTVSGVLLFRHLRGRLSLYSMALIAEQRMDSLQERFISAIELAEQDPSKNIHYSSDLLNTIVHEAATCIQDQSSASIVGWKPVRYAARRLMLIIGIVFATTTVFSDSFVSAAVRCAHPFTHYERVPKTQIEITPSAVQVVKGDDATIEIRFSGEIPRTAEIARQEFAGEDWTVAEIVVNESYANLSHQTVRHTFADVRNSFIFNVQGGDNTSDAHKVTAVHPPEIQKLTLYYDYPDYTGLPNAIESENGNISVLKGTQIRVQIDASKSLAKATIVIDDSTHINAEIENRKASASISLPTITSTFDGHEPRLLEKGVQRHHYRVHLIDQDGVANRDPIQHTMEVYPDYVPQVTILEPGIDSDLPENQSVELSIEAIDDYLVETLELLFRKNGEPEHSMPLPFQEASRVAFKYLWHLTDLELLPEDRITFYLRVTDNDIVSGPKSSLSQKHTLHFPSLFELIEEVQDLRDNSITSIEEIISNDQDTQKYLEQVRREVLKNEELSWEQKKELHASLDQQRERAQALEQVAQQIAEISDKVSEQGLNSKNLLDKINQIRALMEEVTSPELLEALKELQRSTDQADPKKIAEALKEFGEEYKTFEKRLDRTLALLRQVQIEQRLNTIVDQAKNLFERQTEIGAAVVQTELKDFSDSTDSMMQTLSKQEHSIAHDSELFQENLREASTEMATISKKNSKALFHMSTEVSQGNLSGRMSEMATHLAKNNTKHAKKIGGGLEESLGILVSGLEQLRNQFLANSRTEINQELTDAMADLIRISYEQENLAEQTKQERNITAAPMLADEQFALLRGTDIVIKQLANTGQRTLNLNPAITVSVGYARRRMQESGYQLGQMALKQSIANQSKAFSYLNEAANLLRQSLEEIASSAMPSGFGEAMQKLMGLSEQQASLNQATQEALGQALQSEQHGQGSGSDFQSEMARLAAEQQRIMQAIYEIERNMRGHSGPEKRMQAIAEDIQAVLNNMQRRRPHPRMLEAQEHIHQRMLDASRSIYARGFRKKRRSASGEDRNYSGPLWIPSNLGQKSDAWRDAMKRALSGHLPREYREVVQHYYESVYSDIAGRSDSSRALP